MDETYPRMRKSLIPKPIPSFGERELSYTSNAPLIHPTQKLDPYQFVADHLKRLGSS